MDNARIHNKDDIELLFESNKIVILPQRRSEEKIEFKHYLLFQPKYTPQLNPIENMGYMEKRCIKNNNEN
jgi:transposase